MSAQPGQEPDEKPLAGVVISCTGDLAIGPHTMCEVKEFEVDLIKTRQNAPLAVECDWILSVRWNHLNLVGVCGLSERIVPVRVVERRNKTYLNNLI